MTVALTDTLRQRRLQTSAAAQILADDLAFIRTMVEHGEPTAGDVRRMSGQLRRMLIEGDLRKVAAPRVGRINIEVTSLEPLYNFTNSNDLFFYSGIEIKVFGVTFHSLSRRNGVSEVELPSLGERICLNIDRFLDQRIICFQNQWIKRRDFIKYVANVYHGVHTGVPSTNAEHVIDRLRSSAKFAILDFPGVGKGPSIQLEDPTAEPPTLQVDHAAIDAALFPLISAAQYLVRCPHVIELERLILLE